MSQPLPDSPAATLARLAADNEQHLRWLQFKFGASLSDEDLADILQEAHEEAIAALHGDRPPTFPDWARAVAWFRRVCANTAIDAIRRRDGRRASERTTRPTLVRWTGSRRPRGNRTARWSSTTRLTRWRAASLSDEMHRAIVEALRRLDDRDARLLQWRYADELEPEAIMRLEGLSRYKQYEGRHTRAVKALGRAVAGLTLHVTCREARAIMRRQPDALLQPTGGRVQAHLETCVACRAFRLQLRGALAAIPLSPAALGAKLLLTHTHPAATTTAGPAPAASAAATGSAPWHTALAPPKLAAGLAAATLAVGAIATATAGDSDAGSRTARTQLAAPSTAGSHTFLSGESLGEHLTPQPPHAPLTAASDPATRATRAPLRPAAAEADPAPGAAARPLSPPSTLPPWVSSRNHGATRADVGLRRRRYAPSGQCHALSADSSTSNPRPVAHTAPSSHVNATSAPSPTGMWTLR